MVDNKELIPILVDNNINTTKNRIISYIFNKEKSHGGQTWTTTITTPVNGIFDIRKVLENEIKDANNNKNVNVLGTIFLMDGYIYLNVSEDKSIKLGKFGGEDIGKKISREVTKKKLKEE